MSKSILHITDLHLNDFHGTDEHLRQKYYQEYIDDLVKQISKSNPKVDIAVISGDFVDRGKTENFEFVTEIIEYLRKCLKIDKSNICLCIGNHDYKYKEEDTEGKNSIELRKPYYAFSEEYDANVQVTDKRAKLEQLQSGLFYLSLDSTLGSHETNRKGKPGKIESTEVDFIINDIIKKHVKKDSTLLIGCHYPIESFPNSLANSMEDNWTDNHLWTQGAILRHRINKLGGIFKIWFLGDTHSPDHLSYEDSIYIMTGRFGGTTKIDQVKQVSHIPRQCKILNINEDDSIKSVFTYTFQMETHQDSAMAGNWIERKSEIRIYGDSKKQEASKKNKKNKSENSGNILMLSDSIEKMIIERIKQLDLYSFGRFKTGNEHTSLGWISINQLLNEQKILSSIVTKSISRIEEISDSEVNETAIVGLDFWGAIIGSQVSVRTGIKHFCLATRGYGQYHTDLEITNELFNKEIPKIKSVLIFIDVVSTGMTILKVIEAIKSIHNEIKFNLISVISSSTELKDEVSRELNSINTFCYNLKIPVLKNSDLPDESILPPNIDFSIKSQ